MAVPTLPHLEVNVGGPILALKVARMDHQAVIGYYQASDMRLRVWVLLALEAIHPCLELRHENPSTWYPMGCRYSSYP